MSEAEEACRDWTCSACGERLELVTVQFEYMKGNFEVELPACRACGLVLVSEELATGRMSDVERMLEDK